MSLIKSFFHAIIFQPLYNGLIVLYNFIPDLGVGIIILTLLIRFLLLPVAKKSIESQKKLQEIQPEIKKIQEKYKNDRQRQGTEMMEVYRKNNINPASGCLPLVVQIIFLIALYKVFMAGINATEHASLLYPFVKDPGQLKTMAFGFLDLTKGSIVLAALAAALQFWQTKMMMAKNAAAVVKVQEPKENAEPDFSTMMQKQMLYLGPIMTFVIGFKFPAGLPLYWITTTLFMIVHQYYILKFEKDA